MGFDIYHSPSAASVGGVARQAGLGEYSKFMQQMIAQKNARAQQERMQKAQLAQQQGQFESSQAFQQQRDKDYQAFKKEMDAIDFGQGIINKAIGLQTEKDIIDYRDQINQQGQDRSFIQNGWQQYVSQIKDWQNWSPEQRTQFQAIQSDINAALQDKATTSAEKAEAVRQGIRKLQGVQSTVVPRVTSQADKWAEEGKGVGDTWMEDDFSTRTRKKDGSIEMLVKPPTAKEISDSMKGISETYRFESTVGSGENAEMVSKPLPPSLSQKIFMIQMKQSRGVPVSPEDEYVFEQAQRFSETGKLPDTFAKFKTYFDDQGGQQIIPPDAMESMQRGAEDRILNDIGGAPEPQPQPSPQAEANLPEAAQISDMKKTAGGKEQLYGMMDEVVKANPKLLSPDRIGRMTDTEIAKLIKLNQQLQAMKQR